MKSKLWLLAFLPLLATGCSGMNNTERGALAGGGIGGLIGTGIGAVTGHAGAGAAIGAGTGALLGGLAGSDADRDDRRAKQYAAAHPPMGIADVVSMTHNHISEEIIIRQIDTTNSAFQLTSDDIVYLRSQGVSDRVIGFMQARRVAQVQPVRQVREIYYVEQPPPVAVGFGFSSGPYYGHRCRY